MLADRGMTQGQKMAIVLVEQFYDFAAELADQYLVMERGEITKRGHGKDIEAEGVRAKMPIWGTTLTPILSSNAAGRTAEASRIPLQPRSFHQPQAALQLASSSHCWTDLRVPRTCKSAPFLQEI